MVSGAGVHASLHTGLPHDEAGEISNRLKGLSTASGSLTSVLLNSFPLEAGCRLRQGAGAVSSSLCLPSPQHPPELQ